jgi:hypothetical protein
VLAYVAQALDLAQDPLFWVVMIALVVAALVALVRR